jgi:hypothetical protein
MAIQRFLRLHHLTYDPLIGLKLTSLSSRASVLKDGNFSLETFLFYSDFVFSKNKNKVILAM